MTPFWFALTLTTIAGLSTGIGSAIAFAAKKENATLLSFALGLSAGVMVFVSLSEMLPLSSLQLEKVWGKTMAGWFSLGAFFTGVILTAVIDLLIPSPENPHELHKERRDMENLRHCRDDSKKLLRMGMLTAFALAVHNFPEGLATFISAMSAEPEIAYPIAFAVAIHNIPEGISVSIPIFYATGSRKKAFTYSFLSGLAEPLGGIFGYLLLRPFAGDTLFGLVFAGVAGIMVYISLDELLPAAREYGKHHIAILGLFTGMAVMGISMVCLG